MTTWVPLRAWADKAPRVRVHFSPKCSRHPPTAARWVLTPAAPAHFRISLKAHRAERRFPHPASGPQRSSRLSDHREPGVEAARREGLRSPSVVSFPPLKGDGCSERPWRVRPARHRGAQTARRSTEQEQADPRDLVRPAALGPRRQDGFPDATGGRGVPCHHHTRSSHPRDPRTPHLTAAPSLRSRALRWPCPQEPSVPHNTDLPLGTQGQTQHGICAPRNHWERPAASTASTATSGLRCAFCCLMRAWCPCQAPALP